MIAPRKQGDQELPKSVGGYTIVGPLASGGMAELFLARKRGLEGFARSVVVKRILPHMASNEDFVNMFLDEARIAARIRHPNVVSVEELGSDDDDLYMVMEYLAGESLGALMRALARRGEVLQPDLAAHIAAEAAAGLHAAHEMKDAEGDPLEVVHRDVSPQNLFITYDGHVKVLDFGIARAADRLTRTESGYVKGKFEYMAPEQVRSEPLDRRCDVFALGIVLFEMLTARRLFRRDNPGATVRAVTEHNIRPPSTLRPGIGPKLDSICLEALDRSRERRTPSAAAMRQALLQVPKADPRAPETRLAELMGELFGERSREKAQMLRQVAAGETVSSVVPESSSNGTGSDLPRVQSDSVVLPAEPPPSRRPWFAGAVVLLLVGGVTAWLATRSEAPPQEPVTEAPSHVEVAIDSTPSGARATIGTQAVITPGALAVPRGDDPVSLTLELDGFEPVEQPLTPNVDQRVVLQLQAVGFEEAPAAQAEPEPEPQQVEESAPARTPTRMRRRRGRHTAPMDSAMDPFELWN